MWELAEYRLSGGAEGLLLSFVQQASSKKTFAKVSERRF